MARDLPFDFSLPGNLRYAVFDPLGMFLAVALDSRSTVYVHRRLGNEWESIGTPLLGHSGCVLKLTWAHADHGPLLASGSDDCTVKIWELSEAAGQKAGWRLQSTLTMHRERPVDLQFLEEGNRLMLACGSASGEVIVYTCEDRSRVEWKVASSFRLPDLRVLCWGLGSEELRIAVGSGTASQGKIQVWQTTDARWVMQASTSVPSSPTCLAWSRAAGQKCAYLAAGYMSGRVEVYAFPIEAVRLAGDSLFVLDCESAPVKRVDWDGLGVYLSVTWENGRVDVLKRTLARTWKSVANRR